MPQVNKGNKHTTMQIETLHVLDIELAKRVGIVGPYDFVNHGLRGYTSPDRWPTTFRPSLSACDALMVAASLNMHVQFQDRCVNAENDSGSSSHSHTGEIAEKLQAMCKAIMSLASITLDIPL